MANNKPVQQNSPIVTAIDRAAPLIVGGVVLYSFFHKKRDKLQDALMWGGIASQLYRFIEDAKQPKNGGE